MRLILFLVFFTNFTVVISQSTTSINKHVVFSDYLTSNITKSGQCIRSFRDLLTTFKEANHNVFIGRNKIDCVSQPKEYYYNEANSSDNIGVKESWQEYNELYKKNAELIAYIELEDHKVDRGAKGFKIIDEMGVLVESLIKKRSALKNTVFTKSHSLKKDPLRKAYLLMVELIDHEEKVLQHLDTNYKKGAIGLDEEFMNRSYLETANKIKELEKNLVQKYPASSFQKSFIEGVQKLQDIKKIGVDKNNYKNKVSTKYVNNIYKNYLNEFNTNALSFLQSYVEASKGQGQEMYLYPRYIPLYRMIDYEITSVINVKEFEDKAAPPIQVINKTTNLKKAPYNILNEYVLSLNARTHSLKTLQNSLKNFQSSINRMQTKDPSTLGRSRLSFNFDYYQVPENDVAIFTKETPLLFPEYSTSLLTQFSTIQELLLEVERLSEELAIYGLQKKFVNGDFSRPEEILKRMSVLFDMYEVKKEKLYKDVRAIYTSYAVSNPANPWKITSNAMLKAVDASKLTLKEIKNKFEGNTQKTISSEALVATHRDLITNQVHYMDGIKRIGSTHGHDPYNPYEKIPGEIKYTIDNIERIDDYLKKGQLDKYYDYAYRYNNIVKNYNKFAELGKGEVESAQDDKNRPLYILSQTTTFSKFILENNNSSQPKSENTIVDTGTFAGYAHNNLVFLLDVSGSMKSIDKLPLLKKSMEYLVGLMRPEDEISIVIYSGKATLALEPSSALEIDKIKEVISTLKSKGKTNANDGIKLAYKTANDNYKTNGNNRIILATDGELEINAKSTKLIKKSASKDIQLSVLTFGTKKITGKLQEISELGNGNFRHITEENSNTELISEAKSKKTN